MDIRAISQKATALPNLAAQSVPTAADTDSFKAKLTNKPQVSEPKDAEMAFRDAFLAGVQKQVITSMNKSTKKLREAAREDG